MPKVILELEMPESCKQCKLGHYYFTMSEIEGKMAVLFNTISSGALEVDKFVVEVITCETDGRNGDPLN